MGASSRQDSSYSATQTMAQGYTIYENLTESDYWWWYLAIDIADGLLATDEIIYQWATVVDQATENPEDPYTIGCSLIKGTDDSDAIQVFQHEDSTKENMYNDSDEVVGNTWENQYADELLDSIDHLWTAGSTHAGETAPDFTSVPSSTSTFTLAELPSSEVASTENAFALMASWIAVITALMLMN